MKLPTVTTLPKLSVVVRVTTTPDSGLPLVSTTDPARLLIGGTLGPGNTVAVAL